MKWLIGSNGKSLMNSLCQKTRSDPTVYCSSHSQNTQIVIVVVLLLYSMYCMHMYSMSENEV